MSKLDQTIAKSIALLSTKPGMAGTVADQTTVYKALCTRNAVTPEELQEAVMKYLESDRDVDRFFPPAGVLIGYIKLDRQERTTIERAMHWRSLKACEDRDGMPWLAPESLIENGEYVGPIPAFGEMINSELTGLDAPALEMRNEFKERLDRTANKLASLPKRKVQRSIDPQLIEVDHDEEARKRALAEQLRREA